MTKTSYIKIIHGSRAAAATGFVALLLGIWCVPTHAQSCNDSAVMSLTRQWFFQENGDYVTSPDLPESSFPAVFRNTEAYRPLFVSAYPEGKGGTIEGQGRILEPSEYSVSGIVPYQYEARFYPYFCSDRGELVTQEGYLTEIHAQVSANDLQYIVHHEEGSYELNGEPIRLFSLSHQKGVIQGRPMYGSFGIDNASAVLLTHDGKLPYRALTQREFLEAVKAHWRNMMAESVANFDQGETDALAMIEEAKTEYSGETLDMVLEGLNTAIEGLREQRPALLETLSKTEEEEIRPIDDYLATAPASELQKAAIPVSLGAHRGFTTEADDGYQVVIMDDSYFKASLPDHAAQFMVVYWFDTPEYPGARLFRESIENNFSFDKLQALIDR